MGVNGSGKSTLVKCLLRPDYADRGNVSFEPDINVGYVEQGFGSIGRESVWDFMLKANPEILSLRQKLAELEQASASGNQEILDSYGRVTQRYEFLDGYHYEAKLKMVLFGLAFPESMWGMQAASLSGGQKTRLLWRRLWFLHRIFIAGRTHEPSGYPYDGMVGRIPAGFQRRRTGGQP